MEVVLKHEEFVVNGNRYFIDKYKETFGSVPLWRYGEICKSTFYYDGGREETMEWVTIQSEGLLRKPSKKLNYFNL